MIDVVLHPQHPPGLLGELERVPRVRVLSPSDALGVREALSAGAEVLVTYTWDDRFLQPSLRWVAGIGAGYENYPVPALHEADVVFTTGRGVNSIPAAEHALALLLALTRGIGAAMRQAHRKGWPHLPLSEISGMTAGVLGLGAIGEEIARRASALGMTVVGCNRHPDTYEGVAAEVFHPDAIHEMYRACDALFIALPGGPTTRRLVDVEAFASLGSAWVINVGRGSVIDESALVVALTDGSLRGAGLDVFEEEPLPPTSPLWRMENVVLTPHCAGLSNRYGERWVELFVRNIDAYEGRSNWRNRVFA